MKILLTAINAKYIHSNLAVYSLRAYANAYLEKDASVEIGIGEYTINNRLDDILAGIYKEQPDVLCFSCYIWNIDYVTTLAREYHKLCPKTPIWVGGPEVSYEVDTFLKENPAVFGAMLGEGEETFCELCRYYAKESESGHSEADRRNCNGQCYSSTRESEGGHSEADREGVNAGETACEAEETVRDERALTEIAGLAFRMNGNIVVTGVRNPLCMSDIPFCYGHIEDFKNRIIYYESSRGCPFSCSYCLSSVEKHLRFRDIDLVKKELAFFIEKEVPQIKFVDRTFNCNHEHAMEIWHFIKENDKGITNFHFEISADLLNEEELALLSAMRPGLVQLEIGVQSTNPATITEIHRTMELGRLKEVVARIQEGNNIHEHLDLIAGLPFEDYDTFAKSFDEIYALKPNQLQLGFLKVLKGSYMFEHAAEYELLYHDNPPYEVLATKWLSYEEVLRIKLVEEMLEVYYNSGQHEVTLKMLETQFDSAFEMYRQLGEFYEKKGYLVMSHTRVRRAEILLEFVETYRSEALPVIKESLVYDLYYRENLKSRPSFAPDLAEWKELTRSLCRTGKQSHVERFFYRFPERDVCSVKVLPEREAEPLFVWFDYSRRNPLDHQAHCEYVEWKKE